MSRRTKSVRASAVPKVLSLADRASAALESEQRRIEADADALKRSAERRAKEDLARVLVVRGIATVEQVAKAPSSVEVTIANQNVYAVPYSRIDGLRFTIKGGDSIYLLLEVECHLCGGVMWSQNINGLIGLGAALKAKWQHPEGTCPRVTESPRHSRHARKRT